MSAKVFFKIRYMVGCMGVVYLETRCTMGRRPAGGGSAMFSWESLGLGIRVDVTLIVADHVHLFFAMAFTDAKSLFQPDNATATLQKLFKKGLRNMTKCSKFYLGLQIPQISYWTSVECAGQTHLIHAGLNGSAANVLCQKPQGTFRGLMVFMPRRIRAVLASRRGPSWC